MPKSGDGFDNDCDDEIDEKVELFAPMMAMALEMIQIILGCEPDFGRVKLCVMIATLSSHHLLTKFSMV